jgi:hypothetical protein
MQQQMQQMQAAAQDAQQIAAAQQAGQAGQDQAENAMNGQAGNQGGNQQGNWNGGQNGQGQNQNNQWNGQAGFAGPNNGGIGAGDRNYKNQAPYGVKKEVSPSQDDEKGKILASNFIKDNHPIRGKSEMSLKDVARAAEKEQTDEVDEERVSRSAQKVVREYFNSMEKEDAASPSPTTAPSH